MYQIVIKISADIQQMSCNSRENIGTESRWLESLETLPNYDF